MGKQVAARLKWAYSSAGKSARLISVRSVVRVHLSPLVSFDSERNWLTGTLKTAY